MTAMTQPSPSIRALGWLSFASVLAVAFALRLPSIVEPLGIDQGLWASVARGLSRGQVLYRDMWDHKPPGIFLTYLAAFRALGWTPATVAWMDIFATAATTLLLFAIVRRLSDTATGGLAAALYAVLTVPGWLYSHGGFLERSVNETFIVVCAAVAAWCAVRFHRHARLTSLLGLGLSAGAAMVFKPNAGVYLVALLAWVILYGIPMKDGGLTRRRVVVTAGLAALVVPAGVGVWLWSQGLLREAWVASIAYNLAYVGTGQAAPNHQIEYARAIWLRMKTDPLWIAGGAGSALAMWDLTRTRRLDPLPALALAWGGAAAIAIYANGAWLFNSYFIQALAPLAVLASWLLAGAWRRAGFHRWAACSAAALMVVLLVVRNYPARVWGATGADLDEWLGRGRHVTYLERFGGYANNRGYSARANEELEAFIQARTTKDDRIYLFGINGAGAYFGADRLVAQRFLRANYFMLVQYPDPRFTLAAVTGELAAARPLYIIFERLHSRSAFGASVDDLQNQPEVVQLLKAYRMETQIEDFTLYRRAD
jgi:hypothetical protein